MTVRKAKRGPGRPKGSKNKPKTPQVESVNTPKVKAIKVKPVISRKFELRNQSIGFYNQLISKDFKNNKEIEYSTKYYGVVNPSPTNNCQLALIASAQNLIINGKTVAERKEAFRQTWLLTYKKHFKKLCLLDINSTYVKQLKQVFKPNNIIVDSPYKSSNGHKMNLFIINMYDEFKNDIVKKE